MKTHFVLIFGAISVKEELLRGIFRVRPALKGVLRVVKSNLRETSS